jgi:hypothetical protein
MAPPPNVILPDFNSRRRGAARCSSMAWTSRYSTASISEKFKGRPRRTVTQSRRQGIATMLLRELSWHLPKMIPRQQRRRSTCRPRTICSKRPGSFVHYGNKGRRIYDPVSQPDRMGLDFSDQRKNSRRRTSLVAGRWRMSSPVRRIDKALGVDCRRRRSNQNSKAASVGGLFQFQNLVFKGHAFGIVFLEPFFRGVRGGKH